jgi:SAM-dependent methyltransferase
MLRAASWLLFRGRAYHCPCCATDLRRFLTPTPVNRQCPACGSLERQRLLMLYLSQRTRVLSAPAKLLHFAPEQCLHDRFRKAGSLSYTTCDLRNGPMVDRQIDITAVDYPDASFDIVICSHVLQEVENDRKALTELLRVLRPGGVALLQHPIDPGRGDTYEDQSITDPSGRTRAFGQRDHVRIYGHDFGSRVRDAGFDVEVVRFVDELPPGVVERCALRDSSRMRSDDIYVCVRPGAKHATGEVLLSSDGHRSIKQAPLLD